ncbi:MAG: response regulator [Streptosporangiaceae bacterium]
MVTVWRCRDGWVSPLEATRVHSAAHRVGDRGAQDDGRGPPDLVVLDLGPPDVPGETMARELRGAVATTVLVLTAKSAEEDRIQGLELGADDCVTQAIIICRTAGAESGCSRRGSISCAGPAEISPASVTTRSGLFRGPVSPVLACLTGAIPASLARGATHTSKSGSYVPSTEMLDESISAEEVRESKTAGQGP